jgi:hypothetical protein
MAIFPAPRWQGNGRQMSAYWQGHAKLSHVVLSASPPDFTEFSNGACPLLPGLSRVDSWMAKVESKPIMDGYPSNLDWNLHDAIPVTLASDDVDLSGATLYHAIVRLIHLAVFATTSYGNARFWPCTRRLPMVLHVCSGRSSDKQRALRFDSKVQVPAGHVTHVQISERLFKVLRTASYSSVHS